MRKLARLSRYFSQKRLLGGRILSLTREDHGLWPWMNRDAGCRPTIGRDKDTTGTARGAPFKSFIFMDAEAAGLVEKVRKRRGDAQQNAPQAGAGKGEALIEVRADAVEVEDGREAGPEHVGVHFFRKLGMEKILEGVGMSERARALTCGMVMNRLICPGSENAFRNMKSPLAERPIFHQIDRRVETHIFLCILAHHLLVAIEKTLLDQGVHTSWATVRESLKTHQVVTIVLPTRDGRVLRIRKGAAPKPHQKKLYRLLGVPEQIIPPRKSWNLKTSA